MGEKEEIRITKLERESFPYRVIQTKIDRKMDKGYSIRKDPQTDDWILDL